MHKKERYCMNKQMCLVAPPANWRIDMSVDPDAVGRLLHVDSEKGNVLTVTQDEKRLSVILHTLWQKETSDENQTLDFTLLSMQTGRNVCICWQGFSFRLYIDGALQDEDWPLGSPLQGKWTATLGEAVHDFSLSNAEALEPDSEEVFTQPFQYFVLPGHNTGVGDCMPFARDGRYCLYYLFDRRGHASKKGLGAHQWAQVSSADLKHWTIHPMAIGITEQWEGSICTGSLIQREGKTYAFYAVRMADGSPARLTWAVSEDGVHFTKSGRQFSLSAPYEPVSARDPMVFCDAEGVYHMLVTTSLADQGARGGCLAHLTSTDLLNWSQHDPFIVPGYTDQPECSDYFEWNGWYYLVFSNYATARYRMSRSPLGPWLRPPVDELDACEVQVPKTAVYKGRRFSTGFLARRPRTYAGNAITHEIFQRADGTLGVKHLEEILPQMQAATCADSALLQAGSGYAAIDLPKTPGDFRLKATLKPETKGTLMGVCIGLGEASYQIELNPAAGTVSIIRPNESFSYGCGRDLLCCVDLSGGKTIDLIIRGDILDMTLDDGRAMAMRLDDNTDAGATVSLYAQAGSLSITGIQLMTC